MQLPHGVAAMTAKLEPLSNGWDYNEMLSKIYAAIRPGPKVWAGWEGFVGK